VSFRRPHALLVLSVCLAIAAAGCGGGGEEAAPETTTDEYIAQADRICSEAAAAGDAAFRAAFGNEQPTAQEAAVYVGDEMVPALEAQLQELRELTPPEGDTETVNGIWDQVEDAIETIAEDPEASLGAEDPFAEVTPEAEAYGFKSCGVS
jgi:hypothetical protein